MEWVVGKKYNTGGAFPRVCLKIDKYYHYVLLDVQEGIPYSRPLTVESVHWNDWKEYKEPLKARTIYIPVIQWKKDLSHAVIAIDCARTVKAVVKEHVESKLFEYNLLDIIEVTWEQKE